MVGISHLKFYNRAGEKVDERRTLVRQRAIARAKRKDKLPDDEDNWDVVDYPQEEVGWLVDLLESFDYRYTPVQIYETEERYPNLWDAIFTETWQRGLMREEVKAK